MERGLQNERRKPLRRHEAYNGAVGTTPTATYRVRPHNRGSSASLNLKALR